MKKNLNEKNKKKLQEKLRHENEQMEKKMKTK